MVGYTCYGWQEQQSRECVRKGKG